MPPRRFTPRADEPVTSYMLRDVPTRIWKAAKVRAVRDETDMRTVIIRLLERYARSGFEAEKEK